MAKKEVVIERLFLEVVKNAVVVEREILEDDTITYKLQRVIQDVPEDVTLESLKRLMESEGSYKRDDWKYAYKVVFQDDLDSGTYGDIGKEVNFWIENKIYTTDDQEGCYRYYTYDDFLDVVGEEKRITLRIPMGLHTMLVSASKGKSLNTFCMEVLSKAVGFEGVPVASATKKD